MKQTENRLMPEVARVNESGTYQPDDPRLVEALEAYVAAQEAGQAPERQDFLTRYPEIAGELAECLDGLEFIRTAGPRVREPAPDPAGDSSPALGPEIPLGDYHIVREIGRGGMGVVYEAMQLSLGRRVALKVLPFAATMDTRQLQRFKNEAQAAAHLHHQHIVPVYYVGCERGIHFYVMQFIEGQTLDGVIADLRRLSGVNGASQLPSPQAEPESPAADTTPKAGISTER